MGKFSGASAAVNAAQQGQLGSLELPVHKPQEEQAPPPAQQLRLGCRLHKIRL